MYFYNETCKQDIQEMYIYNETCKPGCSGNGNYVSPTLVGRHIVCVLSVCLSVRHTVCRRNSSETTEQNFMTLGR
jgi:hypothetical protein